MPQRVPQQAGGSPAGGLTRRTFLTTSMALTAAAGAEFVVGKAPALAQTRTLHVLEWSSFVPAADVLRDQQAAEFGKQAGVKVTIEHINANDLPARATAAIEGRKGPDILQLRDNSPHLYAGGLEDHNQLIAELGGDKFYPFVIEAVKVDGVVRGVPYFFAGGANTYRKDIFQKVGIDKLPDTWEEHLASGKKLKKFGMPIGQTLGHTFGDAPGFAYPVLWSFGGMEVDEKGKVAINSKETRAAVDFVKEFWFAACDEGGLAWDDTTNNRAFHSGEISATLNGGSIYILARRRPDIKDEKGHPLWPDTGHFRYPDGPHGPTPTYHVTYSTTIMKQSKNVAAAKELVKWLHAKEQYARWFELEGGYATGANAVWEGSKMWAEVDEAMRPFKTAARGSRALGYAGPPSAKATLVYTKYVITDMYAKAVQGMPPEDAVRWAEGELKRVYEG